VPQQVGAAARRWEVLASSCAALARAARWYLEGEEFFVAFQDPGGPLVADILDEPGGWERFDAALLPFLDQWESLAHRGGTLVSVDPARLILGPLGLVTFDLVHLQDAAGALVPRTPFVDPGDVLVLSPEMTGRTSLAVDQRSGLFSLGTLAYRLMAGHWPVRGDGAMERIHALLNRPPDFSGPVWPTQGPAMTSIVGKLLRKDPKERYQTLRGLRWDLRQRGRAARRPFVAGLLDRALPIGEGHRLYGRTAELALWESSLVQLQAGGSVSLVVRGVGGQGKSSLLGEFRRRTEPEGVTWLQGQFDQFEPQFSSGAVAQILGRWAGAPWGLQAAPHQESLEALKEHLGRNHRLLATVIPALAEFWGDPEPVQNAEESQRRLLGTLVQFFGWLASVRPVILAVEDYHWADALSQKILEALVQAKVPRLGILVTCRPEVETLDSLGAAVRNLGPLDEDAVLELLEDSSALERDDRLTLARLLVRLSLGNPFSIGILIREVNLRGAVILDEQTGRWSLRADLLWDLPQGEALPLVAKRMASLSPEIRRALVVASVQGIQFNADEVRSACGLAPQEFERVLGELLGLRLWERAGPSDYRFSHAHLQLAAYDGCTEPEQKDAHLRVGRERLARLREGQDLAAGSIALHLNRCLHELTEDERDELVDLNFRAGTAARLAHDFSGSFGFFQAAMDQADRLWPKSPDRALALHRSAAMAAYTEFKRELADSWCDQAVDRADSTVGRAQIREMQQSFLFFQGDLEGSIQAGIRGLKELGVPMPAHPGFASVIGALLAVRVASVGRSPGSLVRQAENRNERSRVLVLLLCGFIPPAFHAGRQNLFALAVLKATRLALRDGVSPESAPGYTGYAVLRAALGDLRGAYRFGQVALAINRRFDDLKWRSMVFVLTGLFCKGWFEPWDRLRPQFEEARAASEASGDVLYVTYAQLFASLWNPGEDLPKKRQRTEEALTLILKNRFPLTRVSAQFVLGRIRNLEGTAAEPLSFASEGFDPEEGLDEYRRAHSASGLAVCYIEMASTAFLLGDLDRAKAALVEAEAQRPAVAGSLYEEELTLYSALVKADLARRGASAGRLGPLVRQARRWAKASPTFAFHAQLLHGESLDLKGRVQPAQRAFLAAIDAADSAGTLVYQALARERASRFFGRRGTPELARLLLEESVDRWRRYGAWAKVRLLEPELGERAPRSPGSGDSHQPGDQPWDIDHASLVRALEAISRENRIDALSRTLTKLILENSGADRVALLVAAPALVVEGWATADGYVAGDQQPVVGRSDFPQALVRQALHEKRILVREELSASDLQADPVLGSLGVKSVVILPLATSDKFQGLIYLENTVMPGILTLSRVRILELLSSTIGMAIQNAQLFQQVRLANEGLELRVEERTKELGASQRRVALQEKLASLGTLAAGIAHELKNPLNVITNFAESSSELLEDLKSSFESVRGSLPEPVIRDLEYLIPELVQNMVDIRSQGNRGNEIIRTMLMHSRSDTGAATREDLNQLIQETLGLTYHSWKSSRTDVDCSLEKVFDPQLPLVTLVRANLGRVLINLFDNAFQAMEEKGRRRSQSGYNPTLTVSTKWLDPGVRICVEDNGPGIAPEVLDKVFQPFYTTKPPGEGTGLGLSISYEIVRGDFGGSLEVVSEVNRFTRFTIVLPRVGRNP
jgi:signal transduction histidine kinase/predicted ATPase